MIEITPIKNNNDAYPLFLEDSYKENTLSPSLFLHSQKISMILFNKCHYIILIKRHKSKTQTAEQIEKNGG
jgi:hypothetical protein